jgi:broad specificity phosphatase PhoE
MRIHLLRHGESEANAGGFINDDPQRRIALTPLGRQQAESAAMRLRQTAFTHCYASELLRARQTAAILLRHRPIEVVSDARLNERRSGMDGQPVDAFNDLVRPDPAHIKPERGESFLEQMARVKSFLDEAAERHPDAIVLAVSHENPILAAMALAGRPAEDAARGRIAYCAGIDLVWPVAQSVDRARTRSKPIRTGQ